jgi:hypothetical protein
MASMAWPGLVLVEGLPGSGKSSTAQWLAHELARADRPARWVYEQEVPHPVTGMVRGPHASWKGVLGQRLTGWARFAEEMRSGNGATTIVDSTFLQTSIATTLRNGLDPGAILAFLDRVADLVRPLEPVLVHFDQPDVDAAIRRIGAERGMAWTLHHITACDGSAWARAHRARGLRGLLAYWRAHAALCETALPRVGLRTLRVPAGGGPAVARARVAGFLGLPWPSSPVSWRPDPERFAGRYRGGDGRELRVAVRDGQPVLDGLFWPGNRLLPRGPDAFDAEGWPFHLTFEGDAGGVVAALRIDGPALPHRRPAGRYLRVAGG